MEVLPLAMSSSFPVRMLSDNIRAGKEELIARKVPPWTAPDLRESREPSASASHSMVVTSTDRRQSKRLSSIRAS